MIDFCDLFWQNPHPSQNPPLTEGTASFYLGHTKHYAVLQLFQVTKRNVTSCSSQNCGNGHTRVAYEQ